MARTTCLPPRASLVILESIIPTASRRRPPQPRSTRPSPPLVLRTAKTTQRAAAGRIHTADPHSGRIERRAARGRGGTGVGGRGPGASGGMGGACGKYGGDGALRSASSRQTRDPSASASRAPSICRRNYQLYPKAPPRRAVTRRFRRRLNRSSGDRQGSPSRYCRVHSNAR